MDDKKTESTTETLEDRKAEVYRAEARMFYGIPKVEIPLTIKKLVHDAYATAKEKGWHEKERSPLEYHALIHSEVSEATEAVRHGLPTVSCYEPIENIHRKKPEGELIELADAIIRIADYCGSRGWDLEQAIKIKMAYNKTRPHRHGGKKY